MKKSLILLLALITSITLFASDVILSNTLGAYYCSQEPNPKTYIKYSIEEPISIYWEDNIYPGFSDTDVALMLKNYLDGVHLQMMALNTPDGKVKIYSYAKMPQSYINLVKEGYVATKEAKEKRVLFEDAWKKYKAKEWTKAEFDVISKDWAQVDNKREALTKQIESARSKLNLIITETTRDQMPQMNYTVKTDEVYLSDLAQKVIYSDEVKITDNRTKEVIAYNRRIMQLYSASLLPDMVGGRRFYPHPLCGNAGMLRFDHDVFTEIGASGKYFPFKHTKFKE